MRSRGVVPGALAVFVEAAGKALISKAPQRQRFRGPTHFECSPAWVCALFVDGFDRWCRKRLLRLLSRWSRVRFPLGAGNCSGSSVVERRYRPVCSPVRSLICGADFALRDKDLLGRWCRQQLLLERMVGVRIPPRWREPWRGLTGRTSEKYCGRLFPG